MSVIIKPPSRNRVITYVAVLLPAVVMFAVGSVSWMFVDFKGPHPDLWSPYVVPTLCGLLAGLGTGVIVWIGHIDDAEPERLHLLLSTVSTAVLAMCVCFWWKDWVVWFPW